MSQMLCGSSSLSAALVTAELLLLPEALHQFSELLTRELHIRPVRSSRQTSTFEAVRVTKRQMLSPLCPLTVPSHVAVAGFTLAQCAIRAASVLCEVPQLAVGRTALS